MWHCARTPALHRFGSNAHLGSTTLWHSALHVCTCTHMAPPCAHHLMVCTRKVSPVGCAYAQGTGSHHAQHDAVCTYTYGAHPRHAVMSMCSYAQGTHPAQHGAACAHIRYVHRHTHRHSHPLHIALVDWVPCLEGTGNYGQPPHLGTCGRTPLPAAAPRSRAGNACMSVLVAMLMAMPCGCPRAMPCD